MEEPIKISCIIPTCNRPVYLLEAINSVFRQTIRPVEIIIVNNGDKEIDLPPEVKTRVIIYKTNPLIGASAARNYGAKLAKGDFLAFLDDDDLWSENYLKNVVEEIKKGELCIISRMDQLKNREISAYKNAFGNLTINYLLTNNPGINGSNIVIANKVYRQIGGFDLGLTTGEDKSLMIEIIKAGIKIKYLPDNQVLFRTDENKSKLTGAKSMAQGIYQFTKKYKSLMSFSQYLYNWYKIYYYRYKSGRKSAIVPYFFLTVFFSPKRLIKIIRK